MKRIKSTNPERIKLIRFLRKQRREKKAEIWGAIAASLAKPKRKRIVVNISRLRRYSQKNEVIIVPGKVLGSGVLNHPIKVAAFTFSEKAEEKIKAAKGECLSIFDLIKKYPKGSMLKMVG